MNERIRELAEQNGMWDPQGYPSPEAGEKFWNNVVIFEKQNLELFAEAIIRECAGIALHEDHDPSECILTHFGLGMNHSRGTEAWKDVPNATDWLDDLRGGKEK